MKSSCSSSFSLSLFEKEEKTFFFVRVSLRKKKTSDVFLLLPTFIYFLLLLLLYCVYIEVHITGGCLALSPLFPPPIFFFFFFCVRSIRPILFTPSTVTRSSSFLFISLCRPCSLFLSPLILCISDISRTHTRIRIRR